MRVKKATIKSVALNRRKRCLEIVSGKRAMSLPLTRLAVRPSVKDPIVSVVVDPELGRQAITYLLASGKGDSVHLDAFLEYNRDPDFLRQAALHQLTVEAIRLVEKKSLSKHEIVRRLNTSPSQLYRLLDSSNSSKSIDEMVRLLAVLGYRLEWSLVRDVA